MHKAFIPSAFPNKTKPQTRKLKIWTMTDIEQFEPNPNLYVAGEGHIMRGRDRLHLITGQE